jgi:hypothetical protein
VSFLPLVIWNFILYKYTVYLKERIDKIFPVFDLVLL